MILSFFSDLTLVYYITPERYFLLQITIFVILETLLFSIYLISITQSPALKKIILAILLSFLCFSITYSSLFAEGKVYPIIASLESIIVIIFCIIVLFEQMARPQSLFIYSTSSFWIITGILFYLSGIFFLSLVFSQLSEEETNKYWSLNLVFNILKNILFATAFSMKNTASHESSFLKNQTR